jgi:hypothetical protein
MWMLAIAFSLLFSGLLSAASDSPASAGLSRSRSVAPKVKVVIFGDSTAFTLAYTLGVGKLPSKLGYSLKDEARIGCGLPNPYQFQFQGKLFDENSPCLTATPPPGTPLLMQPLAVQWAAAMAEYHPNVVVLLAGRWQVTNVLINGVWTSILNPSYAGYVKQQLEAASNTFTSGGANVVFLTSPCVDQPLQPNGQPWPESDPARIAAYNSLVREVAAENPTTDSVVDLNAIVCPGGRYSVKYKGAKIRLADGIHFTDGAGLVLGKVLMPPILAAGRAQIARSHKAGQKG